MRKLLLFVSAFIFISSQALSHPMSMGSIEGEKIKLQTIGHSFAGSIGNKTVMGFKTKGALAAELHIIEHDLHSVSVFKADATNTFGGDLIVWKNGLEEKYPIQLVAFIQEEQKFVMSFNGKLAEVYVKGEGFDNGHFIKPEYALNFDGRAIRFKMQDGQACYGYSLLLITMIMGAALF